MRPSIRSRLVGLVRAQWAGLLALFLVIAGGTAYAADTVFSTDIVDGQVKSPDIGNNQVQSVDVRDDTLSNGGLGSVDIANNTVASGDIENDGIGGVDIAPNTVPGGDIENGGLGGIDIANGDLNDEDIAQGTFVHFAATVGGVPAHSCVGGIISGLTGAAQDHMLLTPDAVDADFNLEYTVQYFSSSSTEARLRTCNPTDNLIADGTTHFNLLTIDAQ